MKSTNLAYPALFHAERSGGFSISFPDFPEAHTQRDTEEESFEMAVDCLHTAIEWRLEEKAEIPSPRRSRPGETAIPLALDLAPKLALLQTMREQNISNVKLAERLHVSEIVVRRMLNPKHKSSRALTALGRAAQVSVIPLKTR